MRQQTGSEGSHQGHYRALGVLVLAVGCLLTVNAWGAGGDLLWQDEFDGGGSDLANAIVANGGRVFAAGRAGGRRGPPVYFLVRAHDAQTGAVLWQDKFDGRGADRALGVAADDGRVFAAGHTSRTAMTRAYDASTGLVLWTDLVRDARMLAVATRGGRVFSAGRGNFEFLVRALDAQTGALLWQDQAAGTESALAIAADVASIYAVGMGRDQNGEITFLVRAYDGATGALLWEDEFHGSGIDIANAVAVDGRRVFAVGRSGGDFLIRAYQAATGTLLWQDQVDVAGGFDEANAVAALDGRVFAVGRVVNAAGDDDFFVRAYDAETGALLWQDQVDGGQFGVASAVGAETGRVIVAGRGQTGRKPSLLVRAYDASTGALLWRDEAGRGNGTEATALAVQLGQVFIAGGVGSRREGNFAVRAYAVE